MCRNQVADNPNCQRRVIIMSNKKDEKLIFTTSDGYFVETTEKEITTIIEKLRYNLKRALGNGIEESIKVISNHLDCEKLKPEDVAVLIIYAAIESTSNVKEYLQYIHDVCSYSEDKIIVMFMNRIPLK